MLLLFLTRDAAYERAKPSCADAARRAAVEGLSARKAECSPPINNGIDAVAVEWFKNILLIISLNDIFRLID